MSVLKHRESYHSQTKKDRHRHTFPLLHSLLLLTASLSSVKNQQWQTKETSFKISETINLNIQQQPFHLPKKQLSHKLISEPSFVASLPKYRQRLCREAAVTPAWEGLAIDITQVYIKGEETES